MPSPIKPNRSKLTRTRSVPPSPRSRLRPRKNRTNRCVTPKFSAATAKYCSARTSSYLRRFAKLIEVLPARNSATCAKVVAFCSATCYNMPCPWGYSSVGRALEWHSRGQGFDSPYLHHKQTKSNPGFVCFFIDKRQSMICGLPFCFGVF